MTARPALRCSRSSPIALAAANARNILGVIPATRPQQDLTGKQATLREVNRIPPRMLVKQGSTLLVPRNESRHVDVVEHVADPQAYLTACQQLLKPGGLMICSTLNRNPSTAPLNAGIDADP